MTQARKLSETLRIDLLPDTGAEPTSRINRVGWNTTAKIPEYVAESRYRELLEGLYDAAIVTRFSGRILDVNKRAVEFLRYEGWELTRLSILDIISGMEESLLDTLVRNLEKERFSLVQAYCVRKDETFFPAEISVSRLRLEGPSLCFFIRDITLRVESEDRLRLEHEALLLTGNGIAITDCAGQITFANPAFADLLGAAECESLYGQDIRKTIAEEAVAEDLLVSVIRQPGSVSVETDLLGVDNRRRSSHITASCKRSDDGDPLGFVFAFVDLTRSG